MLTPDEMIEKLNHATNFVRDTRDLQKIMDEAAIMIFRLRNQNNALNRKIKHIDPAFECDDRVPMGACKDALADEADNMWVAMENMA
jgi:hypothetical protein